MTGYKSKKAAAIAKTIDEVNWADHEPDGLTIAYMSGLYDGKKQRQKVVFPTMLRKMWSGSEVQAWLDENVNKEKNT